MRRDFIIVAPVFGGRELAHALRGDVKKYKTFSSEFVALSKLPKDLELIIIDGYTPHTHAGLLKMREYTDGHASNKKTRPRIIAYTDDAEVIIPAGFSLIAQVDGSRGIYFTKHTNKPYEMYSKLMPVAEAISRMQGDNYVKVYANDRNNN